MADGTRVCVLIPTLNEAETIGAVIEGIRSSGLENVLVVDGHSADDTRSVAAAHGARVIEQTGVGKGKAIREAVTQIDSEYILMLDGDGTYRPEDAQAVLDELQSGETEHVIGNRFADMEAGAMTRVNRIGNRIINAAFSLIHGEAYTDILSGYRAFTRESLLRARLTADGFGIETELAVDCARRNIPTAVVPVTYRARPDGSSTNLRPVRDGAWIFLTLYRLAKTHNPMFYFGSVGLSLTFAGTGLGIYVIFEWLTRRVGHEILAVVGGGAILLGIQLLIFGILSDLIVTLHHEQLRRLEELRDP